MPELQLGQFGKQRERESGAAWSGNVTMVCHPPLAKQSVLRQGSEQTGAKLLYIENLKAFNS